MRQVGHLPEFKLSMLKIGRINFIMIVWWCTLLSDDYVLLKMFQLKPYWLVSLYVVIFILPSCCSDVHHTFDIHMSVHHDINPNYNQQDATFLDLFISTDALHVSGSSSAHHQEHLTVHTASVIDNQYCCWLTIPEAVCTVVCSWWWAQEPPETCRVSVEINK